MVLVSDNSDASRSGSGTLSGQTETSGQFSSSLSGSLNTTSSGVTEYGLVVKSSSSNGGGGENDPPSDDDDDEDEDDDTDYDKDPEGDENSESDDEVVVETRTITKRTKEIESSDASTGNKRRIAKKSKPASPGNGKASRFNGDTGSSSSTRPVTSSQGAKNTEQVADQLTALVDSLKMRMESEVKKSSEFKLIEIEARKRRRIDEARSEEAWMAKQTHTYKQKHPRK
jgi:hypothetical protein